MNQSLFVTKASQRILLIFAVISVALISVSNAQHREGTTDRVIIATDPHQPHPKALEHRPISAVVRLQMLPDRTIGKVTFDRSSGYQALEAE